MAKKKDSEFAVKFIKGTSQQYDSITPNPYTFYFINDLEKVYLGNIQLSNEAINEQIAYINEQLKNKASIFMKTTQEWNQNPQTIAQKNTIYIYSNKNTKQDEHGNIINIPGVKVGDGMGYLIDLPFIDDLWESHIKNTNIHVTLQEKEFWNNKVRTEDSEVLDNNQNLIFTTH